jgi:hypothetical protein
LLGACDGTEGYELGLKLGLELGVDGTCESRFLGVIDGADEGFELRLELEVLMEPAKNSCLELATAQKVWSSRWELRKTVVWSFEGTDEGFD